MLKLLQSYYVFFRDTATAFGTPRITTYCSVLLVSLTDVWKHSY